MHAETFSGWRPEPREFGEKDWEAPFADAPTRPVVVLFLYENAPVKTTCAPLAVTTKPVNC
jgi:hypothetical protein